MSRRAPREWVGVEPKSIPAELLQMYSPGFDKWWCSDLRGKEQLVEEAGLDDCPGDNGDDILLMLLRTLPPVMRWVVEARTGVWAGHGVTHEFGPIGSSVGLSRQAAEALYLAGLETINQEASHYYGLRSGPVNVRRSGKPQTIARPDQTRRFKVLKRDGYRCQLCGRDASVPGLTLEVDHKIPLSGGGDNSEANLWVLCFDCNRGKGVSSL